MSDQTIVDVVINDSTATVVDNRDLSNLTIDLNATGQLLTNNLISSGNYLDSEIAIVSGIAQSGSNESLTGQINQLSGNLITTGQTLQTQITSNDSDITSLTSNLVTTGQTLTTDITTVSGLIVDNDGDITALKTATGVLKTSTDSNAANLITTGQTLQTQITSNDSDINTLNTNLATTGETLTSEINSISGVVPTGGATNQVLAKIDSTNYNTQWVDQSGGGGGSGTVTSSTATTNYLTKWTNGAGEVIGNSVAYDNGSNIGIGTVSPSSKLHVYGGDAIINTLNIGLGAGTNNGANTSIGLSALSSNTSGANNTAVGEYALRGNTVGINNAAFGSRSLYNNINGNSNTAIGHYALYSNFSGHSNAAVGLGALRNTQGTGNTSIGFYSLYRNSTGTYNVANGFEAGHYIADGSTFNLTGDYNVFIGANTKALADNDQNEIVIGYNTTGAGSNSAVLGNDSVTKTVLKGNVGIGTTVPSSKLHVLTSGGSTTSENVVAIFQANTSSTILSGGGTAIKFKGVSSGGNQQNYDQGMISTFGYSTNNMHGMKFYYKPNSSTALTEGMRLNSSGFLSVGGQDASEKLHVFGGNIAVDNTYTIGGVNGSTGLSVSGSTLALKTGNVERAKISNDKFTIGGNVYSSLATVFNVKDSQDSSFNSGIGVFRSSGAEATYINMVGGNFNLNAPTGASTQFKVAGTNTFAIAANGSISSSTGASLSSGGTWTDASTRELKQDIKDLDYRESLNIIKQLNPVKFAYKKDPKNKKIGFIAEDVPDLVATEDRKGLSALQIVSALTKVVQSQQKEIQQLKRMVKRLTKIK